MKKILLTSLLLLLGSAGAYAQQTTTTTATPGTKKVKIVRVENGVTTVEEKEVPADEPMQIIVTDEETTGGESGHKMIVRHMDGAEGLTQEEVDAEVKKIMEREGLTPSDMKGKAVMRTVEVINGDTIINTTELGDASEMRMIELDSENPEEMQKLLKEHGVEISETPGSGRELKIVVNAEDDGSGETRTIVISRVTRVCISDVEKDDAEALRQLNSGDAASSKNLRMKELNFYPNPSNGHFTIDFRTRNKKEPVGIRIFDLTGRQVYTETFTGESYTREMDLSAEPAGTYFIELTQGAEKLAKKVIIGE